MNHPVDTGWEKDRRGFLKVAMGASGLLAADLWPNQVALGQGEAIASQEKPKRAQISITLDLEMSRNFPTWESMHWDYEKGNLNEETKAYSVEAARRVKAFGGLLHFFAVGRILEQENVTWLEEILRQGHPVGNHTYDHINVTAKRKEDLQFRFQRSPWLLKDRSLHQTIQENIQLCTTAMETRLKTKPNGFRTPGGFANGLHDFPDVRSILQQEGFSWISSLYPSHPNTEPFQEPSKKIIDAIVDAQSRAQPFRYPDGMIEIPMSPISDIGAFRTGRWKLEWFLTAIRESVMWAIENRACYSFLAHPSCLYVTDPKFEAIELIGKLVSEAGDKAHLVGLDSVASSVSG